MLLSNSLYFGILSLLISLLSGRMLLDIFFQKSMMNEDKSFSYIDFLFTGTILFYGLFFVCAGSLAVGMFFFVGYMADIWIFYASQ